MRTRIAPSPELRSLIELQAGAVSREQAIAYGMSATAVRRLVDQGFWQRLAPGVYAATGLAPTWLTYAWAGVMIGGDLACLGGSAAGHLHGLIAQPPRAITVLIPARLRRPEVGTPWEFVRTRRALRSRGAPPRSGVEDTVLDMCADADASVDRLVGLLTDAVQQRLTTERVLSQSLAQRARHPRRALLKDILGDVRVGARSPLERRYLRDVERAHGLPTAGRQVVRRGTEVDVRYAGQRLLVELDGRIGHAGSGKFRDMRRDNSATEDALATLRYGWADVTEDPCGVAEQVGTVLRMRGWSGAPVPCAHCHRLD